MTRGIPGLLLLVAITMVGAVPSGARADDCGTSCGTGRRVCRAEARAAVRACAELCRGDVSRETCGQGCRARFVTAKTTCVGALQECHTSCPPPGACAAGCAADLRACLVGVGTQSCPQTCYLTARTSAMACQGTLNPLHCFFDVGGQLAGCLQGCAAGVHSGAEVCIVATRTCLQGCQGGSPSGAFLETSAALLP